VTIHVKSAGIGNPFPPEFVRTEGQAVVALPQDGALAGIVNQDDCLLAFASLSREQMSFDAESGKFRAMNSGRGVITDLADVARPQSPLLARRHRRRNLAARQYVRRANLDFRSQGGVMRQADQSVGCVEPDTHKVSRDESFRR
jgi:hypothetical protein